MPQEFDVEGVSVRRQGAKPHRETEREKERCTIRLYQKYGDMHSPCSLPVQSIYFFPMYASK